MGKLSAIDPTALAGAIKKMDDGATTLSTSCQSLMSRFGAYGLDTSGLRKLAAIAEWTRDQLPDLRRRHALAVVADKAHPGFATVTIPEPFSVGAADAALFAQATAAHDPASLALVKADLHKHLDDPDFLKAYSDAAPPNDVTAFQGLPADVADKLSRLRLQAETRKPDCPQRLKDLWDRLSNPENRTYRSDVFLLGFDDVGNGHVAVSFGNPDTAANTAVYVPGTGSTLDKANGDLNRALTLYTSANKAKPNSTASIFWLGYDAPGWSVPGPASQSFADAGAPKLAAFVNSLKGTHSGAGHVTVIGHSYGSTVVGDAFAHAGMKADDAIFVGSPGLTVDKAGDLHLDPSHVWASKAKFDPVPGISLPLDPFHWYDDHSIRYGNDPTSSAFGGRTFDAGEGSGVGHAHSEYWDEGPSLDNMTDIVVGQPDKVTAMPTEDKVGVLPNLADLPFPAIGIPDIGGSLLQNLGHEMGGHWGQPVEDAGDSLHEFGEAENNLLGAGGDLLTGDFDGAVHDVEDIGGDLADSGKNAVKSVIDLF